MSGHASFEERLNRLNAKAYGVSQAVPVRHERGGGSGNGGEGKPPSGSGGSGKGRGDLRRWFIVFGLVLGLGVGTLLYVTVQHTVGFSEQASRHAAAVIVGDPAPAPVAPGFLSWLLSGTAGAKPIDFLPAGTGGWRRVTTADAKMPDILTQLTARWPEDGVPLPQHPGYKHLDWFLKLYRNEDIEERVLSRSRTRAMFLHPQGDFLSVSLEVLPDTRALGTADGPDRWLVALGEREAEDLDRGEILETVTLAGFAATNRTEPVGQSVLVRPIGTRPDVPNGVKLAIPLSHRIVLRFDGVVEPRRIAEMLASLDVDTMRAALH
jgi:hypothetical protein